MDASIEIYQLVCYNNLIIKDRGGTVMLDVLKTVNKILRILFIGVVGITAIVKIFDIRPEKQTVIFNEDDEYITSEFDEIW